MAKPTISAEQEVELRKMLLPLLSNVDFKKPGNIDHVIGAIVTFLNGNKTAAKPKVK